MFSKTDYSILLQSLQNVKQKKNFQQNMDFFEKKQLSVNANNVNKSKKNYKKERIPSFLTSQIIQTQAFKKNKINEIKLVQNLKISTSETFEAQIHDAGMK